MLIIRSSLTSLQMAQTSEDAPQTESSQLKLITSCDFCPRGVRKHAGVTVRSGSFTLLISNLKSHNRRNLAYSFKDVTS